MTVFVCVIASLFHNKGPALYDAPLARGERSSGAGPEPACAPIKLQQITLAISFVDELRFSQFAQRKQVDPYHGDALPSELRGPIQQG
jgi:hypothetical protein